MRVHNILILIAAPLLHPIKTQNSEIPTNSSIPAIQDPDPNDQRVKFACNIISTSTDEPLCSGSIISSHFLVSSCLMCLTNHEQPIPSEDIKIGVPQLSEISSYGISNIIYNVLHVKIHPRCIFSGVYDIKRDIGIIQTSEEIELNGNTMPATIPHPLHFQFNISQDLMISALKTGDTDVTSLDAALWYIKVKTIPPNICSIVLNTTYYDADTVYCTPYHHIGSTDEECKADYGAPLSSENVLVGILIHKISCGQPDSAASFVNVTLNSQWITNTVQKLSLGRESV